MLGSPAPDSAEVTAVGYYRPDDRFSPQTNTARIDLARNRAAECANGAGCSPMTSPRRGSGWTGCAASNRRTVS